MTLILSSCSHLCFGGERQQEVAPVLVKVVVGRAAAVCAGQRELGVHEVSLRPRGHQARHRGPGQRGRTRPSLLKT